MLVMFGDNMRDDINILVINSNPTQRGIVSNVLKEAGFINIIESTNIKDALNCLADSNIDLLIFGWNLVRLNELIFIKMIRDLEEHKNLPVIMITCGMEKQTAINAIRAGVDCFIVRPLTPDQMKTNILRILNSKKSRIEI